MIAKEGTVVGSTQYETESEIYQALGHPIRLQLLDFLMEGPRCTCEIEPEFDVDQSTISRHLIILKKAGLVRSHREGVRVIYEIEDDRVRAMRKLVQEMIREHAREAMRVLAAR
jgi:ArsR family transcriptional regulator